MSNDSNESASNRRTEERLRFGEQVHIDCRRLFVEPAANLALGGLNVSRGGVRLVMGEALDRGEAVLLTLQPADGGEALRRTGKVAWVLPLAADSLYVGIAFDAPISPDDLQRLSSPPE